MCHEERYGGKLHGNISRNGYGNAIIGRYGGCFEEDIRRFMCERAYHLMGFVRESWIRGCSDSWTIPSTGLQDYEDTRLRTSSRVRKVLSLAWKASLAMRILKISYHCNRLCVTLTLSGVYINRRVLVRRKTSSYNNHTIG